MHKSYETEQSNRQLRRHNLVPQIMTVGDYELSLLPPQKYDVNYIPSFPIIGFAFDSQEGMHGFASDKIMPFRARANGVAFLPKGCEVTSKSQQGGEYLNIKILGEKFGDQLPQNQFTDLIEPRAIPIAEYLRRMVISRDVFDPLEYEEQIVKLCSFLSSSQECVKEKSIGRWMTKRRLKCVDEFIEAKMSGTLKVKDLASMLNLSEGFFNRSFKVAMGKTPHSYILDRRMAKARNLIITTDHKLSDIAAMCGFASQPHMTSKMKRSIGITPGELR